jgi:hypothetical protein
MPVTSPPIPAPLLRQRISDVLRQLEYLCCRCGYPGYRLVLIGRHPSGDPFFELRIPCPEGDGTVPVDDERVREAEAPAGWDGITEFLRRAVPGVAADAECITLMVERPGRPANTLSIPLARP